MTEDFDPADAMPVRENAEVRLGDHAYSVLEELIVTLELEPGSTWSEARLSERLGIGRTPIREALQRLAADHLVILFRRHGIQITEINPHEQLLVLETRRELERLVSVCAARRAIEVERQHLRIFASKLRDAGKEKDVVAYLRYHFAVKQFTAKCARNLFAARALSPLHALSRRFFFAHRERFGDLAIVANLHADLAEKIAQGDEAASAIASDAMMKHSSELALQSFA